jgi:hypothetical protein
MRVYITELRMPELGELKPEVRRWVLLRAFALLRLNDRFFYWVPTLLGVAALVTCCSIAKATRDYLPNYQGLMKETLVDMMWLYNVPMIGAILGGFIGLQLQRWKLRHYLRDVIQADGLENPNAT